MFLEKNIKKDSILELPTEWLKKAHLWGRISIVIENDEIRIKKMKGKSLPPEKMVGLGKEIFDKDSVALQRELREEWKL